MRRVAAARRALLAAGALVAAAGCQAEEPHFARVHTVTALDDAIGGPTAHGRVGDFLLENDRIRAVIEQGGQSHTPTDVGGTLIDIDLQRPQGEFRSGRGLDQLGQIAPIANLSIAHADAPTLVRITRSKNGVEVTAAAESAPVLRILYALVVLIDREFATRPITINMYNEYELRPGEAMIRIRTTVGFNAPFCPVTPEDGCNPECDDALYDDDCECPSVPARCLATATVVDATPLPDRDTASLLDIVLGDLPRPFGAGSCATSDDCDAGAGEICVPVTQPIGGDLNVCRRPDARDAGIFLGDLLVFGGHLTPFVRGIGYDTETDIRRLFDTNKDTLSEPLNVDAIYATGDRVSLGYFSPAGRILVPLFRGPFSLGTTHSATCATSEPGCLEGKLVRFERWVSVGDGDVASAQAPLLAAAEQATGVVRGTVTELPDGKPRSHVDVYALRDPRGLACDAECVARCGALTGADAWTLDDVRTLDRCRTHERQYPEGNSAVESFARTDPGTDPIADGRFSMSLPPGDYFLVAIDGLRAHSRPVPVSVAQGSSAEVHLDLPQSATLEYAIYDETARPGPGKVTVGHLPTQACADDQECPGDQTCNAGSCSLPWQTLLPLEFGGRRPIDGILYSESTESGRGRIELPPGDYDVLFSRGPHYSADRKHVTLQPRLATQVSGFVRRVIDREGWISTGLHVHASNSIDSGTSMRDRVVGFLGEDMDMLQSSDHDWLSWYQPLIQQLGAADRLNTMVGEEVTTQEYGHFVIFPLKFAMWQDGQQLLSNDAVQWRGLAPQEIIDASRTLATPDTPVVVDMPHPYDYFDFYRIDPVTIEPTSSLLTIINPMLDPSLFSGDFEAMELVNTKNFHRVRRATVSEVSDYGHDLDALIAERTADDIDQDTFDHRWMNLAAEAARRRLHRTVAEQEASLAGLGADIPCLCDGNGLCGAGQVCEAATMTCVPAPGSDDPPPPADDMCRWSRGVLDDWFNMLNRGVFRTGVGGSDEHDRETGFLRNMIRTDGTTPPFVQPEEIADAVRAGKVIVSNGPMLHFTIDGAQIGDMLTSSAGAKVSLHVRVEKAPWYDVDRLEIYRNGHLVAWANGCDAGRGNDDDDPDPYPCMTMGDAVLAWDQTIDDSPDVDSWYVVVVYGLDGRPLSPVYESQILAEINTPEITQRLFTIIPGLEEFKFPRSPSLFPVFPVAITNPIWVDIDGDGWEPPESPPSWCRPGDMGCP